MSLAVNLLMEVCTELGLTYTQVGDNQAILKIHFKNFDHLVLNAALGLNTDAELKLTQDKYYTFQLVSPVIDMPMTKSYVDPNTFGVFRNYITFNSTSEILSDLEQNFKYPLIIKRNSGTQGKNVFLCRNHQESVAAIKAVYSKQQIEYDHVLLGQQYILPKQEYRVIILNGVAELVYLKDISMAEFAGNLSPLHWKNAKARIVTEDKLMRKIQEMVTKLMSVLPIRYAGLDIIQDEKGKLWLIEINSTPQFGEFIKFNDSSQFKRIFKKALMFLGD